MITIPHDVGAERAILGAVLLSPDTFHRAEADGITRDSFYREPHAVLWDAIAKAAQEDCIDLVPIIGSLEKSGKLEAVGGFAFVAGLPDSTPSVANVGKYIDIVLRDKRARDLIAATFDARQRLADGDDVDEVAATLQSTLTSGAPMAETAAWESETAGEVFDQLRHGRRSSMVFSTGIRELDDAIEGVLVGGVTVVVGDTGSGKSALADQIACHLGVDLGIPGVVNAYEMTREEMTERRYARYASVPYGMVRRRDVRDEHIPHLADALERLSASPMITDDAIYTAPRWLAKLRSLKRREGIRWAVLDHAHLVPPSEPGQGKAETIAEVALAAKQASKLGLAVIVVAQMNSMVRKRVNKRPQRGDVAYGGPLEQIASTIIGNYRDELYNKQSELRGVAETIPLKARFAIGEVVRLRWRGQFQRFDSLMSEVAF